MSAQPVDDEAIEALRDERIDWRFKGMPADSFGHTLGEFLDQRPTLSGSGFVGPLLTLDDSALEHNLQTMANWCAERGIRLAPHGKTTMAPQLFQRQFTHGAWGLTAANVSQLRMYRAFGVSTIMLANQLVDQHALAWLSAELDHHPELEFSCWVDSVHGVRLMSGILAQCAPHRPVDVLVELGHTGGRSGARSVEEALDVAATVAASPVLRLVGVAGYEGAIASALDTDSVSTVDIYVARTRELTEMLASRGLFDASERVIVSAGGSSYFDQVAHALRAPWPGGLTVVPVLRSGCYLTHDDGLYRRMSPFGREHRLAGTETSLRPALRIWAQVTSRPEPGLALLTMGRRDVSFDQGLPEPQLRRDRDGNTSEIGGVHIDALADQHAFMRIETDDNIGTNSGIEIGDWIGCGISHPCTTFDKWPLIPLVDGDKVVDLIRTFF